MTSNSVRFREEGNKVYLTATAGLSHSVQTERLQQASNLYYKAYNTSQNLEEKISAAKNLGMVSWRLGKAAKNSQARSSVSMYHFNEALKYLSEAWIKSRDVKSDIWRNDLCTSALSCWEDFKDGILCDIEINKRTAVLYDILPKIEMPTIRADCYIHIATCHFHAGVVAIQEKNFKMALYQMKECYLPVTEASVLGKNIPLLHVESATKVLESDVLMHQCIAESMQANQIGDDLFKKVLMDEENLNIDMVYEVIDWYKQAVLRTREITEVEVEAIAMSRIGKVYDKVLKLKYKAKEYIMRSMQLANSMHPRIFHDEDWFKDCTEILQRYQKETVEQESQKWQNDREVYLKELESELKAIQQEDIQHTFTRSEGFLKYIYKTFPPVNPDHKLEGVPDVGAMEAADLKKVLQKAVVHYHPDRIDVEKHGKKQKVLCEEITKYLTRRYETFKVY